MQNYELLFILPGTLAEDEVSPLVEKVKQALTEAGVENPIFYDMGKSRLAYPIRHIRYGYFQIVRFEAEAEAVPQVEKKLRLISEILRTLLTKIKAGSVEPKVNFGHIGANNSNNNEMRSKSNERSFVAANVRTERPAKKVEVEKTEEKVNEPDPSTSSSDDEVAQDKKKEAVEEKPKRKSTKKKVALDDIDKKLDEILDIDLDKV